MRGACASPPNPGSAGAVVLTAFAILTDGLVYAAYLFLVAVGLTLIFGVMKILNVTHGSFYAFGAYGAATAVGIYFERGLPAAGGFLFMILVAMAIGLVLGAILERGILRFVYGKDAVVIVLVTYATFLMLEDVIALIWGRQSYAAWQPMVAAGSVEIGDLVLSNYDIVLVALAAGVAIGGYWALKYTRYGRLLTAVIFDRETAAAFGVNVTVVYTVTFIIGAMEGALTGALIVGLCRAAAVHLVPQIELFVIYAVMALVLVFRPYGLFTQAQPRKI